MWADQVCLHCRDSPVVNKCALNIQLGCLKPTYNQNPCCCTSITSCKHGRKATPTTELCAQQDCEAATTQRLPASQAIKPVRSSTESIDYIMPLHTLETASQTLSCVEPRGTAMQHARLQHYRVTYLSPHLHSCLLRPRPRCNAAEEPRAVLSMSLAATWSKAPH